MTPPWILLCCVRLSDGEPVKRPCAGEAAFEMPLQQVKGETAEIGGARPGEIFGCQSAERRAEDTFGERGRLGRQREGAGTPVV